MKRVYTIGAAAAKIKAEIVSAQRAGVEVIHAETLENSREAAAASGQPGDIVLLAPACASFDQFRNYEHRGARFKDIVRAPSRKTKAYFCHGVPKEGKPPNRRREVPLLLRNRDPREPRQSTIQESTSRNFTPSVME